MKIIYIYFSLKITSIFHFRSQNLVEEWLQKIPALPTPSSTTPETISSSSALNLSLNQRQMQPVQYSRSSPGAFNSNNSITHINTPKSASVSGGSTSQMDSVKSRAIRDIQLAHTKDMHGN